MSKEIVMMIGIAVATGLFIIINNYSAIKEIFVKLIKRRIIKVLLYILLIVFAVFILMKIVLEIKTINERIEVLKAAKINDELFRISDDNIHEEELYYKEVIQKEYADNYSKPYIPENFEYVSGEVLSGYVIKDQDENEYVWVPCTNKISEEIPKLERRNFTELSSDVNLSYNTTYNEKYKEFLKSALENGGFYISRYELGEDTNGNIVSKANMEIASNYSKAEFDEKIENMYKNVHAELINSYAYDTTLTWLLKNDDIVIEKYDKREETIKTGRSEVNNIYDFIDNMMEMTQEVCYGNRIIRGFGYDENLQKWSRYSTTVSEESYFDEYSVVGARSVLYK